MEISSCCSPCGTSAWPASSASRSPCHGYPLLQVVIAPAPAAVVVFIARATTISDRCVVKLLLDGVYLNKEHLSPPLLKAVVDGQEEMVRLLLGSWGWPMIHRAHPLLRLSSRALGMTTRTKPLTGWCGLPPPSRTTTATHSSSSLPARCLTTTLPTHAWVSAPTSSPFPSPAPTRACSPPTSLRRATNTCVTATTSILRWTTLPRDWAHCVFDRQR